MSKSSSPPAVQALESLQQDHGQPIQLNTNPERPLGVVIRFPTPVVNDRNPEEVSHPEEPGFDREGFSPIGPIVMGMR